MRHKQIVSHFITILVVLTQVLAVVSGALPTGVVYAAPAPAPLAKPAAQGAGLAIGNRVWKDTNANGLQDSGEPGIPGVTVGLYDASGNPVLCSQAGRYDTYADGFNNAVSNGSTGSLTWGTTWSFAGNATAFNSQGNPDGSMYAFGTATSTATRAVDLSVFAAPPTLSFDYMRGNGAISFNVQYSSNGGTSFTTLATLNVSNASYQTITYTLPSMAANAQIRLQGASGLSLYAYFDNFIIRGQALLPVTTVTDSNGLYTFTTNNCLQPSTNYQVRIDTTQAALFGFSLTSPNAGGVTSNDPTGDDSDSDASAITISGVSNAVINAASPATGANNSYDFGFTSVEIGNRVWKDTNANGLQDSGEPGIAGVTVGLYDTSGNPVQCAQTVRYATYQDGFNSVLMNNGSTGSLTWGTSWSFAGSAGIASNLGNPDGSMSVWNSTSSSATRAVDLSVFAVPPTLSFDYINNTGAASYNVQYSNNNGASFTTVATLNVNNGSYQTITYTLPITAANAQIRIQGAAGNGSTNDRFDNVTIRGQVRYPVTTVTDANGQYAFTGAACLQPGVTYQVRIATNQVSLLGFASLSPQNAGGVTSNDPSGDDTDSDAASITSNNTPYAVVTAPAPAVGVNYSYDFGFVANQGAIVIRKATAPTGSSQTFAFTSNAPGYPSFTLSDGGSYTMTGVPVGVYAVTETVPSGWTQAASTCTNVSPLGAIQVSTGSTTICSVLNAGQPTTSNVLTVTKTVNWNGSTPTGQPFNINITGPSFPNGKADTLTAGQTKVYTNVVAGVYTVTETSPGAGWVTTYSVPSGVVSMATPVAATTAGPISGNVFRDFNADGADAGASEPGVAGLTVTAYDQNGVARGSATTAASGNYSFTPTGSGPYRLELTNLPAGYYPTTHGAGNGTSTQFVTTNGGASNINFGVNNPVDYSQSNPFLVTPIHINGDPTNSSSPALLKFGYNSTGSTNLTVEINPSAIPIATQAQIGSTWGVAYRRTTQTIYTSALLRRHAGLGPNGLGAIYATSLNGGSTALFADLAAFGINVGAVPSNGARGLTTSSEPNHDDAVYALVGKMGLGDIDLSDDGGTLYVVNLNDKTLYALNVPATGPGTLAGSYPIPDPGCTGGAWRPFGLKARGGVVYAGGVCDAQTSQTASDLHAYVYRLQPSTGVWTPVLNFALNYSRVNPTTWKPWREVPYPPEVDAYAQPVLADMELDNDGSLILAFLDRYSLQGATGNYWPNSSFSGGAARYAYGDVLRAYNNNGVYVLEDNGTAGPLTTTGANNGDGPGNGEFYWNDGDNTGTGTSVGGLAFKPGSGEIAMTLADPVENMSNGVAWLNNTTGNKNRGYSLYYGAVPYFGKADGLGDLELLADAAPLEIGNRVWKDLNGNGVQDGGEPGINGLTVQAQGANGTISTTVTSGDGNYYFTNLRPNMAYTITINPSQAPLSGLSLTPANMQAISGSASSNDAILDTRDSDAALTGGKATIFYTTGSAGQNNHGLDFGFTTPLSGKVTIGNTAPLFTPTPTNTPVPPTATPTNTPVPPTATPTNTPAPPTATNTLAPPTVTPTNTPTATPTNTLTPTATPPTASAQFGDRVWLESDGDGLASTGVITPIEGIVITATDGVNTYTTTTTAQGYYSFTVSPGLYTVSYGHVPARYGNVAPSAAPGGGTAYGNEGSYQEAGNPDESYTSPTTVGLAAGEANWHVDFAFWLPQPKIHLTKYTNGYDADTATGPYIQVGSVVTWTYVLTNTGNVTLTNITLRDNVEGSVTCTPTTLAPGAGTICTQTGIAQAGQYSNTAVVTGTPTLGLVTPVTSTNPSHYFGANPAFVLKKYTNGYDADTLSDARPHLLLGDPVTWTYVITNTGNVTMSFAANSLKDDKEGTIPHAAFTLLPGASKTLTKQGTVTTVGVYTNIGTIPGIPEPPLPGQPDLPVFPPLDPPTKPITTTDPSHLEAVGLSLGNRVWIDNGAGSAANRNNGVYDAGEPAAPQGIVVELLNITGTVLLTTTTDSNGYYRFDNLAVGSYQVRIPASEFAVGGKLYSYASSTGQTTTFATADNNRDHGDDAELNGVKSAVVTLGASNPTGDVDNGATGAASHGPSGDASDNLTVDFGFVAQATFGNFVWIESDNDGIASTGTITPVGGLVMTATDSTGMVYTTTTNANGYYTFNLPVDVYTVTYGSVPSAYGSVVPSATPNSNTADKNNPGVDQQSRPNNTVVTLVAGDNIPTIDFGFRVAQADLHLVKHVEKTLAKVGDTLVYTLLLTNDGPDTAPNVQVKDLLPAGVTYQSSVAQQGTYDPNTGIWAVGTVTANTRFTLTITVTVK